MLRLQSVSRHTAVESEPALSDKQLWRFLGKGGGKESARRAHRGDCHIPAIHGIDGIVDLMRLIR